MAEAAGAGAGNGRAGERVCASADLRDGGDAVVFDLLEYGRPVRAFVLRFHGRVVGYLNRCRHVPAEMDWQPGRFLDADARFIVCSIHGATYEPRDGRCVGGPCGRAGLTAIDVAEAGGAVYWYPSRDLRPAFDDLPADAAPPGAAGTSGTPP
jgi:nitrite reductase/ring-hydroxylating ferredoxin subunit